jgi:hypothetical protein
MNPMANVKIQMSKEHQMGGIKNDLPSRMGRGVLVWSFGFLFEVEL